jgi:hypothetical protein
MTTPEFLGGLCMIGVQLILGDEPCVTPERRASIVARPWIDDHPPFVPESAVYPTTTLQFSKEAAAILADVSEKLGEPVQVLVPRATRRGLQWWLLQFSGMDES